MKHTETPWEFDGNCGGYITQGGDKIARAYARDDAAFIVRVANDHDEWKIHSQKWETEANDLLRQNELLRAKLGKVANWLGRLATAAEKAAKDTRFASLAEAQAADAKIYRATIKDIITVLPTDTGSVT